MKTKLNYKDKYQSISDNIGGLHACTKKSLPLSVKTLHLDVCILDTTDPSSILRKPLTSTSTPSSPVVAGVETSSAKAGLTFTPRITAATGIYG